jgi:hypothetical protein
MTQTTVKESKEQIMAALRTLWAEYKQTESKVATKEEEVEKEKNKALLEKAAEYTVNNIVNSMATLQLDFGNITKDITQRLDTESSTLEELKKALAVETEKLAQLKQIRLVADALYILRQEHQEKLKTLQNRTVEAKEAIETEMEKTRKIWDKEADEFNVKIAEEVELLTKQREKEETDFTYERQREHKMKIDEYEEAKRTQERELSNRNQDKEKGWKEREQKLAEQEQEFNDNKKKIEGFEDKLKEDSNKAKGEAIKDADKDAKVKADLVEKEWEATKQGYELKIQSLEATIQRQTEQIAEITVQLQTATTQAQNLALRAFQNTSNSPAQTN